jgi:hypothetical protein
MKKELGITIPRLPEECEFLSTPPNMKAPFFPMERFCVHPLVLTAALSFAVTAYAQQDTPQVEARVNGILSQMTLAEKLDYISGEPLPTNIANLMGVFDIKPIPRLGVPEIFGNDGSLGLGFEGFPPGTRYPAGPPTRVIPPDLARRIKRSATLPAVSAPPALTMAESGSTTMQRDRCSRTIPLIFIRCTSALDASARAECILNTPLFTCGPRRMPTEERSRTTSDGFSSKLSAIFGSAATGNPIMLRKFGTTRIACRLKQSRPRPQSRF